LYQKIHSSGYSGPTLGGKNYNQTKINQKNITIQERISNEIKRCSKISMVCGTLKKKYNYPR